MPLFATTALTGPNGEQINPEQRIPAGWAVDDPFVVECLEQGFIVNRDDDQPAPLGATPPLVPAAERRHGNQPPAADTTPEDVATPTPVDVGGTATQTREDA